MVNTREFWFGFVAGAITGVIGYRLYEQNGSQLQKLIQPVCGQAAAAGGSADPTLEDLVAQKERLEDLIAEKKMGA
jgi:hypothetical protein